MAIETLTEEVALNLEEAAAVTRRLNPKNIGLVSGGIAIGVVIGFVIGYRLSKEKIRAEAFQQSEREVAKIRETYRQATAARDKPSVEELIEERGYIDQGEVERPTRPPVPVAPPKHFAGGSHPFAKRTEEAEKDKHDGWSYPYELSHRSPNIPYIIHQDEYMGNETNYSQVTYSYYAGDDVLTDEQEQVIENRENLVGTEWNERWGHGSDDMNVIFVRNSELGMEFEICRTPASFAEEVLGLDTHDDTT